MTEENIKVKQETVKKAIEKFKELSRTPKIDLGKASEEMFYYDEACDFLGQSFVDTIRSKAFRRTEEEGGYVKQFYGDCLLYAIVVYITEKLNEPIFNYFGVGMIVIHLEGACLESVDFSNCNIISSRFDCSLLKNFKFNNTNLTNSSFIEAQFDNVRFVGSTLFNANFNGAKFKELYEYIEPSSNFPPPHEYRKSYITDCNVTGVNLKNITAVHLVFTNVDLSSSKLENAKFYNSIFKNVDFCKVSINENTYFSYKCEFDSQANFKNVDLSYLGNEVLISMFTYSTKRLNWENKLIDKMEQSKYIQEHIKRKIFSCWNKTCNFPVKVFWYCSDYGYSTKRIVYSFFGVSIFFAAIYWLMGLIDSVWLENDSCWGCVANLFKGETFEFLPWCLHGILRTLYFSIVTMTTLGFGDVYADPNSLMGYVLLSCQVIMGYVLLGILITRVSVLFTSNEIPELPPLAEEHKKEDAKIKKYLIFGALAIIAILGWANLLFGF
jgi:uncharacterized protein YjbI with pentapeptide repeats